MKNLRFILPIFVFTALFATSVDAQASRPRKTKVKRTTTTKTIPPLDVRAAREKVNIQLTDLSVFIDKLGLVAQNLETADRDAKAGKLSKKTVASLEANKSRLVEAIRNHKAPLVGLETEFRTKIVLQKYLPGIKGISDVMIDAEDLALAGKFVASKDPLRRAAQKLIDTLALLPK